MTSGGPLIGQSLGPGTVLSRLLDNDFDLVLVGDFLHLEVGDVDVGSFSVAHLYLVLQVGVRLKKILYLFIVDFQKRGLEYQVTGSCKGKLWFHSNLHATYKPNSSPRVSA